MAGNDHIPTAPKDVIGDDGDLRQMRDALRAGKRVVLAPDGHVYVAADADKTTPMTEAQETFIEAKLGQVIEMARQGYGVSVSPDGTIAAERMDHKARVRLDMDKGFNEQERMLIQQAVSDGALVRLHPDGRVEYFQPNDAKPPTGEHARDMERVIAEEISSGRLAKAWQDGETLAVQPDGSIVYQRVAEGPPAVEFPEDVRWGHDPLTSADQLEAEAQSLDLGVGAARLGEHQDFQDATAKAAEQRDTAARAKAAADASAAEADRQVAARTAALDGIRAEQARVAAEATQKRDAGDVTGAEELAERFGQLLADERMAGEQLAAAQAAAGTSRAAATKAAEDLASGEAGVAAAGQRRDQLEDVFDRQEDQARVYRQAAAEMAEAERLDAAYTDLASRNVPDAERVKEAAAQHRAKAEELRTQAEAFDAPLPSPDERPLPSDVRLPPPIFDEERKGPFGANESSGEVDGTAVAAVDPGTDGLGDELEMPPDDLTAATGVTDPLAADPMADVAMEPDTTFAAADTDAGDAPFDGPIEDDAGGDSFDA